VRHTQEHRPDARSKDQAKVQVFLEENQGAFSVFPSTSASVFNLVQENHICHAIVIQNQIQIVSTQVHGMHAYSF